MKDLLINATNVFFQILSWLIIIRVILSWTGADNRYNKKIKLLYDVTEPILEPIRKLIDKWQSEYMLDFSPILAMIFLELLNQIIRSIIINFL